MKVKVNQDACIGCGACFNIAGEVFEMDEASGLSKAKVSEVPAEQIEAATEAKESCPTGAIVSE